MRLAGRAIVAGEARGQVLKLDVPPSFWGGVDLHDGRIIDRTHPRCGACIAGRILVMPGARGSSSSSSALVELARSEMAPAAIVMIQHDPILVIGALVASELYGIAIPIVAIDAADWARIGEGDTMHVNDGVMTIR